MNNIGLQPTFKKNKTKLSYIFHLIELGLSVYDWGKPCLLLILSPRLCLVCCFSVFVPTPSLWPKISCHHITRAGRGSSPLTALRLNQKLNSQWNDTLYRGLWRATFLSLGQPPPLAPPDILKSMYTSLDFLSQYDKVDKSPIPLHAYVNKMNWTVPLQTFTSDIALIKIIQFFVYFKKPKF